MVGISKLYILIQYFIKGEVGPKSGEEKSNTHIWLVFNFNLKKMESKDQTRYSEQSFFYPGDPRQQALRDSA